MKLDLSKLRWFDTDVHNKYPHLTKNESELWTSFLSLANKHFRRIAYDVPLHSDVPPALLQRNSVDSNWAYLTALRLDVLAEEFSYFHIFEIKPVFDMKAIGQLFIYATLLPLTYMIDKEIIISVITEDCPDSMVTTSNELGIIIYKASNNFNFRS